MKLKDTDIVKSTVEDRIASFTVGREVTTT